MAKVNASIPKGTRDFGPQEVYKRQYIMQTLKQVFERFGCQPIETPAMEQLRTLTGKYGEEGDKLLFRILNSGDFLQKADQQALSALNSTMLSPSIAEKGLRYDLTIPFARFVAMHQHALTLPFRRYQIQPVWRADRPQKGRYREFYQCDVDMIGTNSLLCEAELIQIYREAFAALHLPVTIMLNNRKILEGLAAVVGAQAQFTAMVIALDKLDKIGWEKVTTEMERYGISGEQATQLQQIITDCDNNLPALKKAFAATPIGLQGVEELETVLQYLTPAEQENVTFSLTLARGLDYYTGTIFEVKASDAQMGSIGGGGRYDDLTGVFGLPDVSGVGVSFGLDRIYDVMEEKGLFPTTTMQASQVLFVNFDAAGEAQAFAYCRQVRQAGFSAEVYPEAAKMKKQMKYADANGIPFVVLIGSQEIADGNLTLKDMQRGEQVTMTIDALIAHLNQPVA